MAVGSRVWKQVLCRIFPHVSTDGEDWQKITTGTATSNGSAGGTTVISTGVISGAADAYNGRYWIEMRSGTCKGQWKRIVDDDGAGTYTLENNGFSAQIDSGDEFAVWKSPEPVIVADGAGGGAGLTTTTLDDDYRDEDDDFWNGMYLMPITGTLRGQIKQITDFDKTGGAQEGLFTFGAFTAAPAAGDVFLLGRFLEIEVSALPDQYEYIPRPMSRVNYSIADGSTGSRGGDFAFKTRVHGSGTLAAADAEANKSVLDPLFSAAGLEVSAGSSATIGAGSTTTAVKVLTGKWENFVIGQCVEYMGNIRRITAQTDGGAGVDTITVTPPFPSAPVSGQVLHACRTYKKSVDAVALYGCGIEIEIDGVRTIMTGCKGNLELIHGPAIEFSWSFSVDHWTIEYEDAPYNPWSAYSGVEQIQGRDMWAWIDTTQVDIKGFSAYVGREIAARSVGGRYGANSRAGFHHTGYMCGATFTEIMADGAELEAINDFTSRQYYALMVVYGAHADAVAVTIPVGRYTQYPVPKNGDGLVEATRVLQAQDANTSTNPDGTIIKIPDFAISLT